MSGLHLNYGGTFDPVHCGHLDVARSAAEQLGAVVHMVPAGDPLHRARPKADAATRAKMLQIAIGDDLRLVVDLRELRRAGATYTVDTLRELRGELAPGTPIAALIGADAFRHLHTWQDWRELFALGHLVALTRPGHDLENLAPELAAELEGRWTREPAGLHASPAGRVLPLRVPEWPVSSTAVRAALASGRPVDEWVPTPVAAFIRDHGLYR